MVEVFEIYLLNLAVTVGMFIVLIFLVVCVLDIHRAVFG